MSTLHKATKRKIGYSALIGLILTVSCLFSADATKELLTNGTFETAGRKSEEGNVPAHWYVYEKGTAGKDLSFKGMQIIKDEELQGKSVFEITGRAVSLIQTVNEVAAGDRIHLSFMAKADLSNGGFFSCQLGFLKEGGGYAKIIPFSLDVKTGEKFGWRKFEADAVAPPEAAGKVNFMVGIALKEGDSLRLAEFSLQNIGPEKKNLGQSGISGKLDLPDTWVVFGPFGDEDPTPAESLLKTVPAQLTLGTATRNAVTVTVKETQHDFSNLVEKTHARNTAYAFLTFDSPQDQRVTLGMGADWWLQAWLDGEPLYDTLLTGNVQWPVSITNHIFDVDLTKGSHVLAVRFISGQGSSVLAIGGPDDLRRIPAAQWNRVKTPDERMYGEEIVPNGNFAKGGTGNPWIPEGWQNAQEPFSFVRNELVACCGGKKTSLEINTLGITHEKKKRIFTRLSISPGQYKVSCISKDRRGKTVLLIVRESVNSGPIDLIRRIDADKWEQYVFIANPMPYLVIETSGPSHAIIEEISIMPCFDKSKTFANWSLQRYPADRSFCEVSHTVVTEHVPWGKPLSEGALKIISIVPTWEQRLSVELSQRLDIECVPVFFGSAAGNYRDPYWIRDAEGEAVFYDPAAHAIDIIRRGTECILIDFVNASAIPADLAVEILNRVEDGAGLVIVGINQPYYPYKDGKRPESLEKYKQGPWATALSPANVTTEETSYVCLGPVTNADSEFYKYGKGRIAYLRGGDNLRGSNRAEFEFRLSYVSKALLWAAGHVPQTAIGSLGLRKEPPSGLTLNLDRNALPISAAVSFSSETMKELKLKLWISDKEFATLYEKEVGLPAMATRATINLPALQTGTAYLNMQLISNGRICDWQTAVLNVADKPLLKDIVIAHDTRPYHIRGESIVGKVLLERVLSSEETLEIRLLDADGRIWNSKKFTGIKETECPFHFDSRNLVVVYNTVSARVIDSKGIVLETGKSVIVRPPDTWYEKNFIFGLWGAGSEYMGLMRNEIIRKTYGANFFLAGNQVSIAADALKSNVLPVFNAAYGSTSFGTQNEIIGGKNAPARKLCLTSPEFRTKAERLIKAVVEPGAACGPMAYFLDHEVDLLGYINRAPHGIDICFSATCLNDLRTFLKKEYNDIAALNASWYAHFKEWDEVQPIVLSEAVKKGQIARWVDHRRHMDRVWTEMTVFRMNEVRKYDPEGAGFDANLRSGPTINDSFSGIDYWQLFNEIGGSGLPYQKDFVPGQKHSRINWDAGQFWHPHRGASDYTGLTRIRVKCQPWRSILAKGTGYLLYENSFRSHYPLSFNEISIINPDLSISPMAEVLADSLTRIRSGIDTQILSSRRDDSGIGLYCSRASEHVCTAWQEIHNNSKNAKAIDPRKSQFAFWAPALESVNRSYRSVACGQIADGILQKGDIKLLIIPFSQAVSVKETEEIRNFVKNGGCLIADIRPAVSDEHGKTFEQGLLDDVFGVKHDPQWKAYTPARGDVRIKVEQKGLSMDVFFQKVILGQKILLAGGHALGESTVPVFIVNNYGRGKAVLLNFYIDGGQTDLQAEDRFFENLLEFCSVPRLFGSSSSEVRWLTEGGERMTTPAVQKTGAGISEDATRSEDPGVVEGLQFADEYRSIPRPFRFVSGDIEFLAVDSNGFGNGIRTWRIRPQKGGHVYDVMENEYLGRKEVYEIDLPLEGVFLHAVVPYRIDNPLLNAVLQENADGTSLIECSAVVQPKDAARQNHVIRFALFAPDGKEWTDFAVNKIAGGGTAKHTFVLPINAPAGKWRVEAKEAISGKKDTCIAVVP